MNAALRFVTISILTMLLGPRSGLALDPSLEVSQYGHTAWTARDGRLITTAGPSGVLCSLRRPSSKK